MVNMLYKFGILQIFFLSLVLLASLAAADPQTMIVGSGAVCEKIKGIGVTFQTIRQRVVDSLVANAPETGFNLSSYGDESEGLEIYGLVQCRGDMNPSDCRECVSFAKQVLLSQCFSYVSASILLDGCFLRYANYRFYSTLAKSGTQKYLTSGNQTIPNATLAKSLAGLVSQAVNSGNSFSANLEVVESPALTIYSLAQCWRDLKFQDCKQCLEGLYDTIFSELPGEIPGAQVFTLNCFLRVENYSFFHLAALSSSQAIQSESRVVQNVCNNDQMQSASKSDLKLVVDSLARDVAKTGYANFSHRDTIYGLAQCRRDMSADECSQCVFLAGQNLLQTCRGNSAVNILSGCFVRYETYNFYSSLDCKKGTAVECQNINSPEVRKFDSILFTILPKLVERVTANKGFSKSVDDAVTNSSQKIYSLAQCARDIDMEACKQCLVEASKYLNNCSQGALGGHFVSGCCYLRYLTVNFFHGEDSSGGKQTPNPSNNPVHSISGTASMFMALAVVLRKGRKTNWLNRNVDLQQKDEDISVAAYGAMPELRLRYKFETLQSCTGNFNQENKLGQGAFGSVYKGVLPNDKEIAVKRLLFFNKDRGVKEFLNEVNMISNVRHKNLVKLLGCSVKDTERLLVYEYLPNKSLDYHLFDPISRKVLNWEKRFEIIVGAAAGLAYLHHESEIRIIHRDIKASNILLDQNFKPKIADFGLARHFTEGQTHVSTGIAGTLGYMAPEYIVLGQLTEKADIFSFGVLVLEIMSGRKNNHSKSTQDIQSLSHEMWKHFMSNTVSKALDPIILESCGKGGEKQLYCAVHVGLLCTQASPALRPSMAQVVQMLISHNPNLPAPAQPPFMDLNVGSHETTAFNPLSFNNFSYSSFEPR
ncbi:cysteine-rich receptor-like protein kinase 2 [Cryptomeria japonica]|uniref:cysteine-rich receptor-like protein kinase 2 n=1 Tax=Cryptomeria japonica TaxID=3369 RepID=UPI0027DAA482|nr:cysteine-rich receptor-like protein kinase 2 [Cryptomeria japonica]